MNSSRMHEEGFAWVERTLCGKIVAKSAQNRWRPQWFLELALSGGGNKKVVMRGFRNPGYTASDEAGSRDWLRRESEILRALCQLPVAVPAFLGYDHATGWMLMEWLDGDSDICAVADPDERHRLYQGYMEELANLHAIPLETITLSPDIPRPGSVREHRSQLINDHVAMYRNLTKNEPEPILELGIQWVLGHDLPSERPLSLGLGDVGPGQFLFEGGQFRSLIDFEYGMVADPFMEIGMMRAREFQYPVGQMAEHILHYGKCYERLSKQPFDLEAIRYWTVAGPALWNLMSNAGVQKQDPTMVDLVFLLSWETQQKRAVVEAMAEVHGIRLVKVEIPPEQTSLLGPLYTTAHAQFEQHYGPRATTPRDESFAAYSAALVQTLARGNATLGGIDRDNMVELAELLGERVDDWYTGLRKLESRIEQDYTKDFESVLQFLYNLSIRREFLYQPMQKATGCGSFVSLERFDDIPGVEPSILAMPEKLRA